MHYNLGVIKLCFTDKLFNLTEFFHMPKMTKLGYKDIEIRKSKFVEET